MFVHLLTASDWLKYTHNLSTTTKLILLDSLLQDDKAGAIIRVVFFFKQMEGGNKGVTDLQGSYPRDQKHLCTKERFMT